ncbi:hypothetical protein FEM48_Zijuj08G0055600 [Ziziphus jujuba var. spinosa]|uniref:Pentatricopeptide repeat-containing protein n=1 Tax=Ziziphus jujuba var. spinosa TaxID=714518 RepID=A0A978UX97_ZIZJJ|nr:hypothetical protein FEM48_Zijuj08G0055600 [Ziziphus jujuba var. spinosa]
MLSSLLNKCVASLCKAKKLENAEAVMVNDIAVSGKLVDDVAANNIVIGVNCEFRGLNVAYTLFGEMKEAGICPDVTTYNCLIAGATKRNLSLPSVDQATRFPFAFQLMLACSRDDMEIADPSTQRAVLDGIRNLGYGKSINDLDMV